VAVVKVSGAIDSGSPRGYRGLNRQIQGRPKRIPDFFIFDSLLERER